jgi:hypothetical protein
MTDSRRIFLIDRLDDSDSTDCLFLRAIFSWIMIASSADDLCRYNSNKRFVIRIDTSWLIQDNVFLQIIDRILNNNKI